MYTTFWHYVFVTIITDVFLTNEETIYTYIISILIRWYSLVKYPFYRINVQVLQCDFFGIIFVKICREIWPESIPNTYFGQTNKLMVCEQRYNKP